MQNEEWPGTGQSSQVSEQLKRRAGNERVGGRIITFKLYVLHSSY
jgi:hypothetical protein